MGNQVSSENVGGTSIPNTISLRFEQANTTNSPSPREGSSLINANSHVFLFGGGSSSDATGPIQYHDLHSYNTETKTWEKIETQDATVLARTGAASATDATGEQLVIFGGLNAEQGWLGDVSTFNISSKAWDNRQINNGPSPRDKTSFCQKGNQLYLFGGFGPQKLPETHEETEENDIMDDEEPAVTFGWFGDVHVLNTETWTWSTLTTTGSAPSARAAFGMCLVDDNIYIIGGRDSSHRVNDVYSLNLTTLVWTKHDTIAGAFPAARSFHTCVTIPNTKKILLFGGLNRANVHLNDVHILDTEANSWLQPQNVENAPSPRGFHGAVVAGHQLLVFGGSSNYDQATNECTSFHNDLYSLDLTPIINAPPTPAVEEAAQQQ